MKNSNTKKQYVQPALKKYGEVSQLTSKDGISVDGDGTKITTPTK